MMRPMGGSGGSQMRIPVKPSAFAVSLRSPILNLDTFTHARPESGLNDAGVDPDIEELAHCLPGQLDSVIEEQRPLVAGNRFPKFWNDQRVGARILCWTLVSTRR